MLNYSWLQSFVSDSVKWDPILDQFSMISRPYPRVSGLKTIPFPLAHTHIANIWEYPQADHTPKPNGWHCEWPWLVNCYFFPVSFLPWSPKILMMTLLQRAAADTCAIHKVLHDSFILCTVWTRQQEFTSLLSRHWNLLDILWGTWISQSCGTRQIQLFAMLSHVQTLCNYTNWQNKALAEGANIRSTVHDMYLTKAQEIPIHTIDTM